jgi:archaellum component FlaC
MAVWRSISLILISLLLMIFLLPGCGVPREEYEKVERDLGITQTQLSQTRSELAQKNAEVQQIEDELTSLNNKYNDLEDELTSLQTGYDSLTSAYDTLQTGYNSLTTAYNTLQTGYNSLTMNYTSLESSYNQLSIEYDVSDALRIGHLLADYYDEVREGFSDSYSGFLWWLLSVSKQDQVDFAADLTRQGLGKIYWPSYEDTYYNRAGEHSYTTAKNSLDEVLNVIGIQVTDSSTQKIEKILEFITAHVHYEHDFNNAYLAPMETLGFRSGDCDDFAILGAALFEAVGIDSAVGLFSGDDGYHAMVLVHLDNISPHGNYFYSDLTSYGLQSGKWIIIEPQTTIENQLTDWVNQWTIKVVAEI